MRSIRPHFHPQARKLLAALEELFADPSRFQSKDPIAALTEKGNAVYARHPLAASWGFHGAVGKLSYDLWGNVDWKLGLLHDLEEALDRIVHEMGPKEVSLMGWASRSWRTHKDILELLTRLRMELAEDVPLPFDDVAA